MTQTIALATTIIGMCLTTFLTALIVLAYGEQIWTFLWQRGLLVQPRPQRPAPFPANYVIPFQRPEPAMGWRSGMVPNKRKTMAPRSACWWSTTTTHIESSSEELIVCWEEPQNATPGPSHFHWTPTPTIPPSNTEEPVDEPLGSVCSEFMDLSCYLVLPSL